MNVVGCILARIDNATCPLCVCMCMYVCEWERVCECEKEREKEEREKMYRRNILRKNRIDAYAKCVRVCVCMCVIGMHKFCEQGIPS